MCAAQWLLQQSVNLLFCCCEFYFVGGGGAGWPKKKKKKALWSAFTVYPSVCTQDSIWLCQLPCFPTTGMPLCIVSAYVFVHTIRTYVNKKVRLCASIRPRLMLDFSSKCQYLKKWNVPLAAQPVRAQKKQMQNFELHTKHILCLFFPPIKQTLGRDHNKRVSRSKKTSFVFKSQEPDFKSNVASCLLRHFHNTFMKAVSIVLSVWSAAPPPIKRKHLWCCFIEPF